MSRVLSDIRQVIRQLLRDEFAEGEDLDWEDDELNVHIDVCLDEISDHSPYLAFEPVLVTANSKLLDISGLADLMRVRRIEYEPGASPRNYHNFDMIDNQTIEMKIAAAPSESGSSGTLTGTVTFTAGSATVTGSGSDFDGELEAGDYIKPSSKSRWYRVYSVESDTSLTLDEAVKSADDGEDTVNVTQYRHNVALVYYEKLHVLDDKSTTLNTREENALITGVCGKAALSKSKYLINRINFGGSTVPREMESWGLNHLALYHNSLNRLQPPVVNRSYSEE
jgi:hypothetical protein